MNAGNSKQVGAFGHIKVLALGEDGCKSLGSNVHTNYFLVHLANLGGDAGSSNWSVSLGLVDI